MIRLLALCIFTLLSIINPMLISATPQDSEPNSGSIQAIISILRKHGQASEDTYCYACRWAGQLGNQELPSDLAREFDRIDPEFIRFYRHVRTQMFPILNEYGGTIPENQRGPECTSLLQPFIIGILSYVGEQMQRGEVEGVGSVTTEDVTVAFKQFRKEFGTEENPLYNCYDKLEKDIFESADIMKAQFGHIGIV